MRPPGYLINLNSIYHFNIPGENCLKKNNRQENFMENTMKQNTMNADLNQVSSKPLLTGIITGQLAGLIMAVVVMIVFALFLGKSPLYPVQVIGSVLFGEQALQGFHLGAVYGLLAAKFQPQNTFGALLLGLGVGVVSMVGPYALIPFVMNIMQGVDLWNREVPMFWDWAAHLVFGMSFALYPIVQRKLGRA
jgi:hypothetical protein